MAITSIDRNVVTQDMDTSGNVNLNSDQVMCDCTAGAITATLYPSPGDGALHQVIVEKVDSGGNAVLVTDGTFSFSLSAQYDAVICQMTDAGVWFGVSGFDRSGTGDVEGPAVATDNAIVRYDGTTGKVVQNSTVTVADTTGAIAGTQSITLSGATSGTVAVAATATGGQLTVGTGPTTVTDSAGKVLSAALNTVAVAQGGTGAASASITAFNNITGFTAAGATGTTSTNLVFSTSPALVTPTLGVASATSLSIGATGKLNVAPKTNDVYGAAIALDVTISNHVIAAANTTSASCTITPSAAGTAGDWIFIDTVADGSGTVTVTFASTFHPSGTQATTANHFSSIAFKSTGTVWVEQYRTTDLA